MTGRTTIHRLTAAHHAALTALAVACGLTNPHQRGAGNLSALVARLGDVAATPEGTAALISLLRPTPTPGTGTGATEEPPPCTK